MSLSATPEHVYLVGDRDSTDDLKLLTVKQSQTPKTNYLVIKVDFKLSKLKVMN